jgi:TPR repeat protein
MEVLPIHASLQAYAACCGKVICGGCDHQHQMKSGGPPVCAFCRTALPRSDEENLARLRKRAKQMDPHALHNLALEYGNGGHGLPVDHTKCIDLLRQSAGLGLPEAQSQLAIYYYAGKMGLEQNMEKAIEYCKKAAEGGHLVSRHNLGCTEAQNCDFVAAMRHMRLSASGGYRVSMENLIECFGDGLLRHADLAETLQTYYLSRAEKRSDDRDQWIKHLKETGEYEEEYGH